MREVIELTATELDIVSGGFGGVGGFGGFGTIAPLAVSGSVASAIHELFVNTLGLTSATAIHEMFVATALPGTRVTELGAAFGWWE